MAKGEALDAVTTTRPFAGVHLIATAMLVAGGASDDELELARRILEKDPKRDAPRENESVAGAFNRHMDAAIESCNDSAHAATRAERRAQLAHDLDKADLVLLDRAMLAALFATIGELRLEKSEAMLAAGLCSMTLPEMVAHLKDQIRSLEEWDDGGEDLGAELLDGEPGMIVYQEASDISPEVFQRVTGGPIGGSMKFANGGSIDFVDGDGGSFSGLEFIGGTELLGGDPDIDRMDGGSAELDPGEIDGRYASGVND
jgi:hypothetical protein